MFYSFNEKQIVNYSKRYSERIANAKVDLAKIKNDSRFSKEFSLLFEKPSFDFFDGDNLYLEGTNPLVSFDFVYHALNKKTFHSEPWYIVMDQCSDFFALYDANVQSRFTFVAINKAINAEDYVIPLFILFLNYRSVYSKITPALFIHDGQIVFRFEYDSTKEINKFITKNSNIYKLLINELKLEDKELVDYILENELEIETNRTIVTIRKQLYSVRYSSKKERMINYIKAKRIVSAQELADYFNLSKRMINYYIAELINEGVVIRVGEINSSNARYKINDENYYF